MTKQRKAYLYTLTAIAFWSTMGTAFKLTLEYASPPQLLLFCTLTSFLVLSLIMLYQGSWEKVKQCRGKDWVLSALLGLLNPFAYYLVLFQAYSMIPAQEAVALNYTWPVVLLILSIPLLKQRPGWQSIAAILVSFCGALLVLTKGDFSFFSVENPLGSLLALGSSLIWAFYWIMNVRDRREETLKLWMNFGFALIYILIFCVLTTSVQVPSLRGVMGSLYIGTFEMGITFLLWLKALQASASTSKITRLVYLSPFISLILIHFLVGETIHLFTFLGLLLIIGGILWEGLKNK